MIKNLLLGSLILMTSCSQNNEAQKEEISQDVEIVRSLEASAVGVTSPSGATLVEEILQVSFGVILNTESKTLIAKIRNNSTAGERLVSAVRLTTPENHFTQVSNSCSNIAAKSSCDIRMSFNGKLAPQNAGGDFSGQWQLTFSDNSTKIVQMNIQVDVPLPPSQEEIDAQVINQISNVTFTPSGSIEMGELSDKESKTISIQIKNNNSTPVTFPTSVQSPFTLTTGCSTISAKGTCTARITINGAGKEGQQTSSFSYGTKSTPISAFVKTTAQVIATTPLVENIIESSESLIFGDIKPTDTISRQVTFTNKSNLPVTLQTNLSNPNFTITSNSCNNSQVAINSSCTVRVSLNGAGKTAGPLTGTLTYGTTGLVNLSANILSQEVIQQQQQQQAQLNSNIVMVYGSTNYTHLQTLSLGSKNQGVVEQLTFNLRNIGTAPATLSQASFASNMNIFSNSCNTSLAPNSSCQIRASLNPQSQAALNLSVNLGFEVRTFPIEYTFVPTVVSPPVVAGLDSIIINSNTDTTYYSPFLIQSNNITRIGNSDDYIDAFNGFFLAGRYHFMAYDNQNGNFDWAETQLLSYNLNTGVRSRDVNISLSNDDSFSYSEIAISNNKVFFISGSWLYSWTGISGEEPVVISGAVSNRDLKNLGNYVYFSKDASTLSRVNSNTLVVEDIVTGPGIALIEKDSISNKIYFSSVDGPNLRVNKEYNPSLAISGTNPKVFIEPSTEEQIKFVGFTNNTIFYIKELWANDSSSKLFARNKNTGVDTLVYETQNSSNVTVNLEINHYNGGGGAVLFQNGSDVYLSSISRPNNLAPVESKIWKYNESTNQSTLIMPTLSFSGTLRLLDLGSKKYVSSRSGVYELTSSDSLVLVSPFLVEESFVLDGIGFVVTDLNNGQGSEIYKINTTSNTLEQFSNFTSGDIPTEIWHYGKTWR